MNIEISLDRLNELTTSDEFITCPLCGENDDEPWESHDEHQEECHWTCPHCGESYMVAINRITKYTVLTEEEDADAN